MLQKMFAQGVRDLQLADERECRDVLTTAGDLGELALEEADVGFEVVTLPHLDNKKPVVVSLKLSPRCVLREEGFSHLLENMERM